MKILDIGSGVADIAGVFPPDAEIVTLDIDKKLKPDYLHDITKPLSKKHRGIYDAAICMHVLEHIKLNDIEKTFGNIVSSLKDGGQLLLAVPSLEWCARELLKDKTSPAVLGSLYGSQDNPYQFHKSGFKIIWLRALMARWNMAVQSAKQTSFKVDVNGKEHIAVQNVIIGIKMPKESKK